MTDTSNARVCGRCRSYLPPNAATFLCTACVESIAAEARHRVRDQFLQAVAEKAARQAMEARP
jgi:hypothetical protein